METQSIRIDKTTLSRIRKDIKGSGYTLSGYINTVLKTHIDEGDKWFEDLTGQKKRQLGKPAKK